MKITKNFDSTLNGAEIEYRTCLDLVSILAGRKEF